MNKKLWMLTAILTCGLVLASCSSDDDVVTPPEDGVEAQLQQIPERTPHSDTQSRNE